MFLVIALRIGIQAEERKRGPKPEQVKKQVVTHDDVSGVFVSTNVGVLEDECALEVP